MEKRIVNKIKALQGSAANQEEFMKQLAGIDENGQLTESVQEVINGGVAGGKVSPLIEPYVLGLWIPTFPDTLSQDF